MLGVPVSEAMPVVERTCLAELIVAASGLIVAAMSAMVDCRCCGAMALAAAVRVTAAVALAQTTGAATATSNC